MPKLYPREFRDDVVAVAQRREPGVTFKQIPEDFRILQSAPAKLAAPSSGRGREKAGHDRGGVGRASGTA